MRFIMSIQSVPLDKAFRLINHGATTLVSAQHNGVANIMAAAWVCALDFNPSRLTLVLDKSTFTRPLIEQSGYFAIQLPTVPQAELVLQMGISRKQQPNKIDHVPQFYQAGYDVPLVQHCAAWLICKVIPEPHCQQTYDLFLGEVVAAWADDRVFRDGHWQFDDAPDDLKTLHYVSGGQFYITGKGLNIQNNID